MSRTHYTSDLHFRHKNIVKFTDRGNETTKDEHDEWWRTVQ
jgi:calcineurin-like phosphoesterase family protein